MGPSCKPCLCLLRDNALFILTVVWICCFPPFLLLIITLIKGSKITLHSSLINMEFLPLWKYCFDIQFYLKFQRIESCIEDPFINGVRIIEVTVYPPTCWKVEHMRKPSMNFVFEEWNQRLQASYHLKYVFTEYIQESIASWETLKIAFMLWFLFPQYLVTVFEEGICNFIVIWAQNCMLFSKLEIKPSHSKINWEHQLTTMKKHTNKSDFQSETKNWGIMLHWISSSQEGKTKYIWLKIIHIIYLMIKQIPQGLCLICL